MSDIATQHLQPGDTVPVLVEADSSGDVAQEGDAVHLKGEDADAVIVELVESVSDRAVGMLVEDPEDMRRDTSLTNSDFSSDEEAGMAEMMLAYPVWWMATDSGYTPSVSDYVEVGDGGDIESYTGPTATGVSTLTNTLGIDNNGGLEEDSNTGIDVDFTNDAFPFGLVFTAIARQWGVGDRTGVLVGVR